MYDWGSSYTTGHQATRIVRGPLISTKFSMGGLHDKTTVLFLASRRNNHKTEQLYATAITSGGLSPVSHQIHFQDILHNICGGQRGAASGFFPPENSPTQPSL